MSRLLSLAAAALVLALSVDAGGVEPPDAASAALGRRPFSDPRDPPPYRSLDAREQAQYDLGHAVFNTHWAPAGAAGAARRDGLGPLFNSESCDSCHNEGARGRGPFGDGTAPGSLVFQLQTPGESSAAGPDYNSGYGHILNTEALDGLKPEAVVTIRYRERTGLYPDGSGWSLRVNLRPALRTLVAAHDPQAAHGAGHLWCRPARGRAAGSDRARRARGQAALAGTAPLACP